MKTVLVIGHTFPEPTTTAAGARMMQLLQLFQGASFKITFASTAAISEKTVDLENLGVTLKNIKLNDASFDVFVKELNADIVVFDRFLTEEQFGWRVSTHCPNALKILDTEDLHFLRKSREEAVRKNLVVEDANLFSDVAKREVASIFRCDLSLIISEYEMELLQNTFKIPSEILYYLPFLISNDVDKSKLPRFEERKNFLAIGNLLHAPNVDSVLQLKKFWGEIRTQLPKTELHIYGAYAPQRILELHNEKEGFLVKGWAEDVESTMSLYRVQLAPLRFGAGLKGKLVDAMRFGLPSVTTNIGAEGLTGGLPFGGAITTLSDDFSSAAVQLYNDENLWSQAQRNGFDIILRKFKKEMFASAYMNHIQLLKSELESHRQKNFIGQVLQHHSLQSTKYMSKWIESKNALRQNVSPVCFANSDGVRNEFK
jgi:glycosyltransferase involved in cell wall biosynthesis